VSNDRLGVRWGLAAGSMLATVDEACEAARFADAAGFDSLWISHALGIDPIMALACVAADAPRLSELGTSVVPLYGRHPIPLAQLAMSAQTALQGRFTLGVGAGSTQQAEGRMGLAWDRPYSFTREFIDSLEPLLAGKQADVDGEQITTHARLSIGAPPTPILLAALGPRMLTRHIARPMRPKNYRHVCASTFAGKRRCCQASHAQSHGLGADLRDRRSRRRIRLGAGNFSPLSSLSILCRSDLERRACRPRATAPHR
jgi:hypothetical protein